MAGENLFKRLVQHLVDFEEQIDDLIDIYYPATHPAAIAEREKVKGLMTTYVREVERLLELRDQLPAEELPFVTIGSRVQLCDRADGQVHQYEVFMPVTLPNAADAVSCFSPLGRNLLLKKKGDVVQVHAPGGVFSYQVQAIKYA